MGTGYTRNDTANNIADGNVINASDLDGEFDAIQAAFNATTGHSHDGTSGEGPQITAAGIANDAVALGTKTTGNYVAAGAVSGVGLSGSASSEGATFTVTSNATSANTASTIVARDASGNFSAGTITASLTGTASNAALLDSLDSTQFLRSDAADTKTSGDLSFADNVKATFGAGNDLQVYHDGSHSYISDQGTGDLKIIATNFEVNNAANTENIIKGVANGAVELYFDNNLKLATASTGVSIPAGQSYAIVSDTDVAINRPTTNTLGIKTGNTQRMRIANGGDISFYADNGTTQGFFWDASTQRLGLGTTALDFGLTVEKDNGNGYIASFRKSNSDPFLTAVTTGSITCLQGITSNGASYANTAINPLGGSVGIGEVSPAEKLDIGAGSIRIDNDYAIGWGDGSARISGNGTSERITFTTSSAEKMRLDNSGNLLVGKTTTDIGTAGHVLYNSGVATLTRDGSAALRLNRLTSDGEILDFKKAGTTVGSIGTNTISSISRLRVGSGDVNLMFRPDIEAIQPANETGVRDNAIDLGNSAARFKDLYLSGQATVGTAVANTHNVSSASGAYAQNFDTYQHFKYEMSGNVTLNNPTTEEAGQSGHMIFIQDATGGRTLSLGTDYETVGGAGITLSSAPNATDIVPYVVLSSGRILLGTPQLAFS